MSRVTRSRVLAPCRRARRARARRAACRSARLRWLRRALAHPGRASAAPSARRPARRSRGVARRLALPSRRSRRSEACAKTRPVRRLRRCLRRRPPHRLRPRRRSSRGRTPGSCGIAPRRCGPQPPRSSETLPSRTVTPAPAHPAVRSGLAWLACLRCLTRRLRGPRGKPRGLPLWAEAFQNRTLTGSPFLVTGVGSHGQAGVRRLVACAHGAAAAPAASKAQQQVRAPQQTAVLLRLRSHPNFRPPASRLCALPRGAASPWCPCRRGWPLSASATRAGPPRGGLGTGSARGGRGV